MTAVSSNTLVALALSTALAGPALAQQQGGQTGQRGNQQTQQNQQQFGQQRQRNQQQARAPEQYRQEQGRVVQVRPARVRGVNTPNYLVVIETRPGRRVVADVGQGQRSQNLQAGTPIAVRGQIVRVGNRGALLLADAIRVNNQTYDVNRPAYRRTGMSNMESGNQQLGQSSGSNRYQDRASLRRQLRQAGFQSIRILDASFLVQAQTPNGSTVLMMVDPPHAALLATGGIPDRQGQSSGSSQGRSQPGQNSQQGNASSQGGSGNQSGSTGSGG
ncbi:hypothetical protein ACETIH_18070 [Microvirga arabica]|uniref:DUF5666 domain-containing protein n=1 Tax=Microvirga arabica TaxID=1128671 RepID=A0ABV6YBB5_9HYPH